MIEKSKASSAEYAVSSAEFALTLGEYISTLSQRRLVRPVHVTGELHSPESSGRIAHRSTRPCGLLDGCEHRGFVDLDHHPRRRVGLADIDETRGDEKGNQSLQLELASLRRTRNTSASGSDFTCARRQE